MSSHSACDFLLTLLLHSRKFKGCSFSSIWSVFLFSDFGGSGRSAKTLKKAGLKLSWHSELPGGFILCIAQISHETQVQTHSLGVLGIFAFPCWDGTNWSNLFIPLKNHTPCLLLRKISFFPYILIVSVSSRVPRSPTCLLGKKKK